MSSLACQCSYMLSGGLLRHQVTTKVQHQIRHQPITINIHQYGGFQSHGGTPLSLVDLFHGKSRPLKRMMVWGTPHFRKPPISGAQSKPTIAGCEGGHLGRRWKWQILVAGIGTRVGVKVTMVPEASFFWVVTRNSKSD